MNCKHQTRRDKDALNNPQLPECEFSGPVEYSCLFMGSEDLCSRNPENTIELIMAKCNELQEAKKLVAKEERKKK